MESPGIVQGVAGIVHPLIMMFVFVETFLSNFSKYKVTSTVRYSYIIYTHGACSCSSCFSCKNGYSAETNRGPQRSEGMPFAP